MPNRDNTDRNQNYDPKGAHGGDTGPTDQKGKGPKAEKGDQRRETPVHGGPSRPGHHDDRSGSDSNEESS